VSKRERGEGREERVGRERDRRVLVRKGERGGREGKREREEGGIVG
jgi:hypothetical protein